MVIENLHCIVLLHDDSLAQSGGLTPTKRWVGGGEAPENPPCITCQHKIHSESKVPSMLYAYFSSAAVCLEAHHGISIMDILASCQS